MSKQSSTGQRARNAAASTQSTAPQKTGAKQLVARQTGTAAARRNAPAPKRGFRLRPLDMALVVAGVLVVGFIVASGLTATTPSQSPAAGQQAPAAPLSVGSTAPGFTLPGVDGNTYSLDQYRGKVVLLEFMAPWCPHCQNDAPVINQVYEAYKDKGVEVLAVSATDFGKDYDPQANKFPPITMDDMKWFQQQFDVKHPMLFDKELVGANAYGVDSYPTLYIVDQNGVVAAMPELPFTAQSLAAELDIVLK